MQTPPAMAHEFDDTIHAHGDALARAFAESPPSAVGNPPARFRPGKHPLDTVVSVGNPHPVRVPEALEEAMRLQSLERFARRKETEARTLSPLRKAEVRELAAGLGADAAAAPPCRDGLPEVGEALEAAAFPPREADVAARLARLGG